MKHVTHDNLIEAGFDLKGETYVKDGIEVTRYDYDDRKPTYHLNGKRVETMDELTKTEN